MLSLKRCFFLLWIVSLLVVHSQAVSAGDGLKGWEIDSEYNSLYEISELDRLKGNIEKIIKIEPLEGMAQGVGLIIKDGDGEKVTVHIGPKAYLGDNIGLKRGDRVKIRGAWAELDGEDVFLASKIKRGDYFVLKVRLTKDGKPFWVMSPEELAREKAAE